MRQKKSHLSGTSEEHWTVRSSATAPASSTKPARTAAASGQHPSIQSWRRRDLMASTQRHTSRILWQGSLRGIPSTGSMRWCRGGWPQQRHRSRRDRPNPGPRRERPPV